MSDNPSIEAPMFDQMRARKTAPPTPSLLDATLPPRPKAAGPAAVAATPALAHEMPSVGSFFAQHRALVDERKDQLARLGMTPEHARALAMPDLADLPQAPAAVVDALPPANRAKLSMPKDVGVTDAADERAYARSDLVEE